MKHQPLTASNLKMPLFTCDMELHQEGIKHTEDNTVAPNLHPPSMARIYSKIANFCFFMSSKRLVTCISSLPVGCCVYGTEVD